MILYWVVYSDKGMRHTLITRALVVGNLITIMALSHFINGVAEITEYLLLTFECVCASIVIVFTSKFFLKLLQQTQDNLERLVD